MKNKSVFSASAVVAGNGIGSGVMAIPYFILKTGIVGGSIAFLSAYLISVLLHLMIAQILLNTGDTADILSAFHIFLFRGKLKNILRISFFVIMVVVLETNLAAYISGAAEIMWEVMPGIPAAVFAAGFYIAAAVTVLLGLRAVSVGEGVSVSLMGMILLIASVISIGNINHAACESFLMIRGIPETGGVVASYSMIMFSFSAIFAMPQVIGILGPDRKEIRKSVFYGLFMNLVISVTVTACAIITSSPVTKVAVVGWAEAAGGIIRILGSLFILFAMFTSYWSIGFATTEIISHQTKKTFGLSFVIATVPALAITFVLPGGFMEYMKIAGGAVAVIISLMVIPTYLISSAGRKDSILNRKERSIITIVIVSIMYLVMAAGSFISV